MVEETIGNDGVAPKEVSADAGYYSAKAVQDIYALGVDPFIAPDQTRPGREVPPAPRGRIPNHLPARDRMRRKPRTRRGRQRYALRMETVEPVFGQIKQGWGFRQFLRYPKNVTFCAESGRRLPARAFVPRPDTAWTGSGTAFGRAAAKRRCTLLAVWYAQQEEPWTILTDLPPDEVGVSWYALRFWTELGFKAYPRPRPGAVKSLGWQWQKTRRTAPARISRHWFVLSVATFLTLAYGTRVEDAYDRRMTPGSLRAPPKALAPMHPRSREKPGRTVSVIRHGITWLRRLLHRGRSGAGYGCCPNPGLNPSPAWRSPAMPLREHPVHTPVSPVQGDGEHPGHGNGGLLNLLSLPDEPVGGVPPFQRGHEAFPVRPEAPHQGDRGPFQVFSGLLCGVAVHQEAQGAGGCDPAVQPAPEFQFQRGAVRPVIRCPVTAGAPKSAPPTRRVRRPAFPRPRLRAGARGSPGDPSW